VDEKKRNCEKLTLASSAPVDLSLVQQPDSSNGE
jgi:hypothetical protein